MVELPSFPFIEILINEPNWTSPQIIIFGCCHCKDIKVTRASTYLRALFFFIDMGLWRIDMGLKRRTNLFLLCNLCGNAASQS